MMRHDVFQLREPPQRQRCQDLSLVRDGRRQHHVKDGDPIRGDQDDVVPVTIDVAYLARVQELHAADVNLACSVHSTAGVTAMAADKKIGYVANEQRVTAYKAQTGRKELTPRQARRVAKKARQGKA